VPRNCANRLSTKTARITSAQRGQCTDKLISQEKSGIFGIRVRQWMVPTRPDPRRPSTWQAAIQSEHAAQARPAHRADGRLDDTLLAIGGHAKGATACVVEEAGEYAGRIEARAGKSIDSRVAYKP
jgi:hypothetical protein